MDEAPLPRGASFASGRRGAGPLCCMQVTNDGRRKGSEHRGRGFVPETVDFEENRAPDSVGEGSAVLDREDGVGGAVNDDGGVNDLGEAVESAGRGVNGYAVSRLGLPSGEQLGPGEQGGFGSVVGERSAGHVLPELDEPLDSIEMISRGSGVEAVHHLVDEVIGGAGEAVVAGTGGCADQRERVDPSRLIKREDLADHPAHRPTDEVSAANAQLVENADHIGREIIEQVPGIGTEQTRSTAVAVIESDDLEASIEKGIGEPWVPAKTRRVGTGQQDDRRSVTVDIHPEFDVADPDDLASVDVSCRVGHPGERYR